MPITLVHDFLRDEDAATATEYAVLLALVLAVIVATVTLFGQNLGARYQAIQAELFG